MTPTRSAGPLLLALLLPNGALAQPAVQLAPGTTLFQLDLAGTPVGEFPTAIKQTKGSMTVVVKGGVPMLKASAASEFLITLPQPLPQDFTLEFDLVPKLGSNPQDLAFEGTPAINQGTGSAHLLWHATGYLSVIGGGGDTYESPMPEALRATLPGVLTHVVADFQGTTIQLYTNGQRHYTLDKQFARGRVLRVFLGGQDGGSEAVYLAGLRISTGSGLGIIAAQAGLPTRPPAPRPGMPPAAPSTPTNPPAGTPPAPPLGQRPVPSPVIPRPPVPPPIQPQPPVNTPPTPPAPTPLPAPPPATRPGSSPAPAGPPGPATLTATDRAVWGATLRWSEVPNAAGYQVDRSEAGGPFVLFAGIDAKAQPPVAGYFATEDVTVLPGVRYEYRVMARFASGPASQYSPTATFDAAAPVAVVAPAQPIGPVNTSGSATRNAARCAPGPATGAPPLNYQVGYGRVGGAVLEWWKEANAEYLVERSPDPGDGSRSWFRLTSTCDTPDGMYHFMRLWEDGNSYPAVNMADVYPGLQLGAPYVYRVTVIRPDGTSGSSEGPHTTSGAVFLSSPIAAVNGNSVTIAADISYCTTPSMRCDPWMMEFLVTSSSVGFQYSSRQPWMDSYDPRLPLTVPGGVEGAFAFTISGVPSGTHTFTVTAIYQPDFKVSAGAVTVVVP